MTQANSVLTNFQGEAKHDTFYSMNILLGDNLIAFMTTFKHGLEVVYVLLVLNLLLNSLSTSKKLRKVTLVHVF